MSSSAVAPPQEGPPQEAEAHRDQAAVRRRGDPSWGGCSHGLSREGVKTGTGGLGRASLLPERHTVFRAEQKEETEPAQLTRAQVHRLSLCPTLGT